MCTQGIKKYQKEKAYNANKVLSLVAMTWEPTIIEAGTQRQANLKLLGANTNGGQGYC